MTVTVIVETMVHLIVFVVSQSVFASFSSLILQSGRE